MQKIKLTFRNGYVSKSCFQKLAKEYYPKDCFVFMTQSIEYTGQITFQRNYINDTINGFIDFLTEKGLKIK